LQCTAPLDKLVNVTFEALAGRMEDELDELGERLFRQTIASRIYPQARQLVHAHRKAGHRVVLATSATPFQADPVAADMGFDAVLCTRPKVQAGMLTGDVDGDILWCPARHGPSPATPSGRASASPAASPTATAPRTCRCSRRSAIRGR